MSIDEVEEKFTFPQVFIMTTIQSINDEDYDSGKQLNRGKTKEEKNANAFRLLR